MKKFIATALIAAFIVTLAGCGDKPPAPGGASDNIGVTDNANDGGMSILPVISPETPEVTEDTAPDTIEITVSVEGTEEPMTLTKYAGATFRIYYDAENFEVTDSASERDGAVFTIPDSGIWMSVEHYKEGGNAQALMEMFKNGDNGDYEYRDGDPGEAIIGEYTALKLVKVRENDGWNDDFISEYFIETENGVYVLSTAYFLEAEEGWGARMTQILDTFTAL